MQAVAQYAGVSFQEALELPCDLFLLCRKNWVLDRLSASEEGRAYLEDCRRLTQTVPDREGLCRLMGRLEG